MKNFYKTTVMMLICFFIGYSAIADVTADFTADQTTIVAGDTIQFTDLSTGSPTSWEWDFENDGTIDSYQQNPEWVYIEPGLFTVSLTVSDGTTSDTETKTDYIDVRVNIPDTNFKVAINGYLGQPPAYNPTIADLNGITGTFNAGSSNISSIEGAQYLTNLTKLYLYENQISDISAVSGLTNLTSLNLYENQISDISAVSGLTNLTSLYLYENQISDIFAVSGLTNLTSIQLRDNQISDISAVSDLTNLENLNLGWNQISDISAVSGLTNLNYLNLRENLINDISAVSGLTDLTMLILRNNLISDISVVSGLTNLTYLYLDHNQISDISVVSGLTNLSMLWLRNNLIIDISPVSGLINLTDLGLSSNEINDISAVSGLTNLTYLQLSSNQISDISSVSELTNLTRLYLSSNQISDISAVSGLMNLIWLYLQYNQINDISAVSGLTNLIWLHLYNNQISDIFALVENTGLGSGDKLYLYPNPLSQEALNVHIPILESRGFNILQYPYTPNNYAACYPCPVRNESGVSPNSDLEWRGNFPADNATYDVWLGETNNNLVNVGNGTAINDTLYFFTPSLMPDTDYWWKIRAITEADTLWSGLWHFTSLTSDIQQINLSPGFSFVSSRISPDNPDMLVVVEEILNENLHFIRNSQGQTLRKIGPNWINGIGDWIVDEGYLVKMFADDSFTIMGAPVNPSTPIPVEFGFQFVSYFPAAPMDALVAFATIIGDDLDFIRNSQGQTLRKIGPIWVNGIGDATPSEGYIVKMYAAGEIIYPVWAKSSGKTTMLPVNLTFERGNPAEAVYTIYVEGLEIGDEVAAYNGENMVGSTRINSQNAFENELPVFSTLTSGQGYKEGNQIRFKVWSENKLIPTSFTMEPIYDSYVSDVYPEGDGKYSVVNITKGATENVDETISVYPNPSDGIFNITIEGINGKIQMKVLDVNGNNYRLYEIEGTNNIITKKLDLKELVAGVYFIKFSGKGFRQVKKIVIQ